MKIKTATSALSAIFLGAVLGITFVHERRREATALHQSFMNCFIAARETDYPSRATLEERTTAEKKAAHMTNVAFLSAGIRLDEKKLQDHSKILIAPQIVIDHCAAKTGVQIEGKWTFSRL